jgi:hypothetical protein
VFPETFDFGQVRVGDVASTAFDVSNEGTADLTIGPVGLADPLNSPYTITGDTCSGQIVPPAGSCAVTVEFQPSANGDALDTFDVPSNDFPSPALVEVSGFGVSLGGSVTGMRPGSVVCRNLRTGHSVTIPLAGMKEWDCEVAGLIVGPGDRVQMRVTGRAD